METVILLELLPDEKEIIFVTHDESIFYANDGKRDIWTVEGEMSLRKKENRRSIMISEFLTEDCDRLQLTMEERNSNPHIPSEAREIIKSGKNLDGYWTTKHLIKQLEFKAILIFETKYPNTIGLFAFDNSSNHGTYAKDALVASRMNLDLGGKQSQMHDTIFNGKI